MNPRLRRQGDVSRDRFTRQIETPNNTAATKEVNKVTTRKINNTLSSCEVYGVNMFSAFGSTRLRGNKCVRNVGVKNFKLFSMLFFTCFFLFFK